MLACDTEKTNKLAAHLLGDSDSKLELGLD